MVIRLSYGMMLALTCSLLAQAEVVVLDFSSPHCGPCRQMDPVVQQLERDGFEIRKIDVTRQPEVADNGRFLESQLWWSSQTEQKSSVAWDLLAIKSSRGCCVSFRRKPRETRE